MKIVSIHLNEMKGASLGQEHLQEAITSPAESIKQTKKKKESKRLTKPSPVGMIQTKEHHIGFSMQPPRPSPLKIPQPNSITHH